MQSAERKVKIIAMGPLKSVLVILLAAGLAVSCSSTDRANTGNTPSPEEAAYAMEVALSTTMVNAGQDFLNYTLASEDFIPPSYAVLREYSGIVPGMQTLLEIWRTGFSAFLEDSYSMISERLLALGSDVKFDNPFSFVQLSSTSATDYFVALHGDRLKESILETLSAADFSPLEKARVQYNVWVRTNNFMYGTSMPELEDADLASDMTLLLYNILTGLLARNEDLFRTTPDPFGDPRVRAVFGIE